MPSSSFFLRSSTTFVSVLSLFSTSSVAAPSQFKARQSQQQSWNLDIDYFNNQGQSFFDQFTFFTGADPTHGFVNYVPRDKASQAGLYNSGTLISGGSNGQSARMDVDYTKRYDGNAAYYNVPGVGRPSVRLESNHIMNAGSLAIVDLNHMPASTCGSWPAFWALGANPWPDNGEVDIIEGWNQQANNFVSAHTNNVCKLQSGLGGMSGQIAASDCDTYYPEGQYNNDPNTINYTGCKVNTADSTASKSFGTGFNNAGGGVYAMLWKTTSISVYFWSRNEIPQDVSSGSPNPDSWTKAPIAVIGGNSCNIAQNFNSMHLIFDTTFCGDAADNAGTWSAPGGCKSQIRGNPTCSNYVGNNPSVFQNSYWDVKGLRVYKLGNKPATTTTTTTTTTKSSTTTTKTTTTTTTTTTTKASTTTTTTTSKPATTTTTTTSKPASTTTTTTAGGSTTTTTTKSGSTTTTTTKSGTTTTTTTKSGTTTTTASGSATTTSTTTKAATTTTTAAGVTTTTTTTKSGTTTTTGAAATTTTTTKSGSVTTTTTKSDAARTTTSTVSATTSGNGGDPWAQWPTTAAPTTTGKPVTNGGGFYGSSGTWSEWTITTGSESTTCSQPQPTTTTSCSTWHKDIPGNPVTSTCSNAVVTPTPVCWVCDEDDDDTTSPVGSATWGSWAEPTSTPAAVTSTWASWSGDDNGNGNGGKGGLPTLVVTVSPSAGQTWATWSAEPTSTDPAQTWATWNGNGNGKPVEPASGSSTWATWNSQSTPVQAASSSWASWASQSTPVQAASSTWATWNGAGASSTPVAASTASSWASWSSGAAATGPKSPVATYAGGAGKTSAGVVGVMAGAVMAGAMLL